MMKHQRKSSLTIQTPMLMSILIETPMPASSAAALANQRDQNANTMMPRSRSRHPQSKSTKDAKSTKDNLFIHF